MMVTDVEDAAEQLDALVERVVAGEEILIAVNGRPVAVMRALSPAEIGEAEGPG